jgi:DNA-directed RNA polymerase subunit omega
MKGRRCKMMIYPPITELVKKTGSRYALVIETAKRTRQLVEGAQKLSDVKTSKDVTIAVNEIYENKIEAVAAVKETTAVEEN